MTLPKKKLLDGKKKLFYWPNFTFAGLNFFVSLNFF